MRTKRITLVAALSLAAFGLAGCGQTPATDPTTSAPAPSPTTAAPEPTTDPTTPAPTPTLTEKSTPPASPTPTPDLPQAAVPATCDEVGTPESRATTIDMLEAQPAPTESRELPEGATIDLGCSWFAGDVTGVSVIYSSVDEATAQQAFEQWSGEGITCSSEGNYSQCVIASESDYNGNTISQTKAIMYAGTTWIVVNAGNLDVAPLMSDIGTQVWG